MGRQAGHPTRHHRARRSMLAATMVALAAGWAVAGPARAGAGQQATVGSAKATAIVIKVAPTVGALELALGSGISVAEVRNQLAQAQSQSADLGLIGSALVSEGCDGRPASFQESDLPHAIRVDNRQGDATAEAAGLPIQGESASGGWQRVRATTQPLSEAVTTAAKLSLGPAIAIDDGRATARTEVVDGTTRIAEAEVVVHLTIPGVLELENLRWFAHHRTGTDPKAEATFEFGRLRLAGQDVPIQDLDPGEVLELVNEALVPLGLTLSLPRVERFTEPADLVRITPLQIRFGGSALGTLAFGTFLDATRQLRDDLAALANDVYCRTASAALIAEIALAQLSGTGSTRFSIGGAEATTGLQDLEDPFGDGGLLEPASPGDPPAETPPGDLASEPARPEVPPPASADGAGSLDTGGARTIGTFERVCESVHPARWPSCSAGAGPFVGLAALLATVGIAAVDLRHQQRRLAARGAGADG